MSKTKLGKHSTAKNNAGQPTSENKAALYPICSPDRWGLRFSDADSDPKRKGALAYPVARDYAKLMEPLLTGVQWGNAYYGPVGSTPKLKLQWPLDTNAKKGLVDLIMPVMAAALTARSPDGGGIPVEAVPQGITLGDSQGASDEDGHFNAQDWSLVLVLSKLKGLFDVTSDSTDAGTRYEALKTLKAFADTIYHESRHCQQSFWIYAFVQQHPDNFPGTQIDKWPGASTATHKNAMAIASQSATTPIPDDPPMIAGIKRMAVAQYLYSLSVWRSVKGFHPLYLPDDASLQKEYETVRALAVDWLKNVGHGGTPIDIDGMVAEPNRCSVAYRARPWENDAFFCGDMASAYWDEIAGYGFQIHAADQCSNAYDFAYAHPEPGRNPDGTTKLGTSGEGQ
ncbi:hypothetical protein G3O06_01740 [Burkholderia sp. Ac-20345]|uniref:hypothetical protein n=1 Tax=Burkholderia sp. Ac-20345 TaxID=2703891 RepID=UPI00197B8071|nr:hypothetical protein [Burkholderia sp. Ac-20345]MBN3776284.1 hypothetical protein [Burkholderia sp. Ac-20345]